MRNAWVTCIIAIVVLAAAGLVGCEDEGDQQQQQTPASTQPASNGPTQPQFQPLKLATQPATLPMPPPDWNDPSSTRPSTRFTAEPSTSSASRPADPLETAESAVRYLLDLCGRKEVPDMILARRVILEPPPDEELVAILNRIRARLLKGATWEIVQTHRRGSAGVVLYRMTYRGRSQYGAFSLFQQADDRWKVIVGDLAPLRYTRGERDAMALEAAWAQDRLTQLNAAPAPATSQAASPPATQASSQASSQPTRPPPPPP